MLSHYNVISGIDCMHRLQGLVYAKKVIFELLLWKLFTAIIK